MAVLRLKAYFMAEVAKIPREAQRVLPIGRARSWEQRGAVRVEA
jgi:hypothetical protein